MKAGTLGAKAFAAAWVMIFAGAAASAGPADEAKTPAAPAEAPAKAKGKKVERNAEGGQPDKPAAAGAGVKAEKPKAGRYATEAEAKAHCPSGVVWIDKNNFNHWPGSREYGRQPGSFGCENS
jgi:hypothetical protein